MLIAQHETAIDSYHRHVGGGKALAQRQKIIAFIELMGGSWSIGELAHSLHMEKSTVSARVNELLHQTEELEERPRRKDKHSGITIRPVALPAIQLGLF
jgi:hypothetical protein